MSRLLLLSLLLGNPHYQTRQAAFQELSLNLDERILLIQPSPDNLEQQIRLRQLQDKYTNETIESWYLNNRDSMPWISMKNMNYVYNSLNTAGPDRPLEKEWPRWRRATALYLRDKLREGLTFREIGVIIEELQREEDHWKSRENPPLAEKGYYEETWLRPQNKEDGPKTGQVAKAA